MKHFLITLGVSEDANWHQIREGYRDQVKVWHPDRFAGDERLQRRAEEKTKEIHYALRRLKELRSDLERSGTGFDEKAPFLKQYAVKTKRADGAHGNATPEDRSRGYTQESFANWSAVRQSLFDKVGSSAARLKRVVDKKRLRRKTVIIKTHRPPKHNWLSFIICSGILILLACVGAINLPKFLNKQEQDQRSLEQARLNEQASRELVQMMLKEPPPNYEKDMGMEERVKKVRALQNETRPALHEAAMNCNFKRAAKLIHQGETIDRPDSSGQTALIWAAKRNCASVAKLLLTRGADATLRTSNGFTPHRWARWYRSDAVVRVLEKHKIYQ